MRAEGESGSLAATLVAQARRRARERYVPNGGAARSQERSLLHSELFEWLRARPLPALRFDATLSPSSSAFRHAVRVRLARVAYTFLEPYLEEQRHLIAKLVEAACELAEAVDGLSDAHSSLASLQAQLEAAVGSLEESLQARPGESVASELPRR